MSMQHKAFKFDWASFDRDLRPILINALQGVEPARLVRFIDEHFRDICDPYEGEPLLPNWRTQLQAIDDVQELGDFALTRYYDPLADAGVGGAWTDLTELIQTLRDRMLGQSLGPPDNLFDPGRMGSYFQTPELTLDLFIAVRRVEHPCFVDFCEMLQVAVANGNGLYVTF